MKINAHNIEQFIKNIPNNIRAILVYGPDHGLVRERVRQLSNKIVTNTKDPFLVDDFVYDKIKDSISKLAESLFSLGFFNKRKLIRISDISPSYTSSLQEILEKYQGNNFVILSADDLPPSSSIRKYFENAKDKAVIACYKDEQQTIRNIIAYKLKLHNFSFNNEIVAALEANIHGDRMLVINEIEKLITYMGDIKEITFADIEACSTSKMNVSLDDLCNYAANADKYKAHQTLAYLFAEDISPIAILRTLLRYFTRLHQVKIEIEAGKTEAEALKILAPPLFFKQVPNFILQIKKYSSKDLMKIIKNLAEIEANCKKTGMPMKLLCEEFINNL